jgi:hypothetical protein
MTVCFFYAFAVKSYVVTLTDSVNIASTSPICAPASLTCIPMRLFIFSSMRSIDVPATIDNALRDDCLSEYADFIKFA